MPYIRQTDREVLNPVFADNPQRAARNPGELNYQLTVLCEDYLDSNKLCYQTINDIVGALEGAKLEFYRRVAAKYEDTKIKENGDIYNV